MRTLGCRVVFLKAVKTAYSSPGMQTSDPMLFLLPLCKDLMASVPIATLPKEETLFPSVHRGKKKADVNCPET